MEISQDGEPQKPNERDNVKTERGKVNRKFRMLRIGAGLTQKEIESATGIPQSTISYFERGFEKPDEEQAVKIAEAFGCLPADILKCFPKGKVSRSQKD